MSEPADASHMPSPSLTDGEIAALNAIVESPRSVAIFGEARRNVNDMFDRYRSRFIDDWEPDPMPADWDEPPTRREIGS